MTVPYTTQAVIAYDNVFARGTLTASSSPVGGEAENAVDGLTWDYWQPTGAGPHTLTVDLGAAEPVDYLALHAQNLATTLGSLTLEGSADGAAWTTVSGPHSPADTAPLLFLFAAVSYRYYRVSMTGAGSRLGVLQAGTRLTLPEGIFVGVAPASLNPRNEILNSTSEGGQFLGRSLIRTAVSETIKQDRVSQSFARNEWRAFADHAALRPFFYAWRANDYPLEVMYAWSRGDAQTSQQGNGFMSVELAIEGQA